MESDEDETFLVVVGDDTDKSFPTCIKSENEDYPISECSIEYLEDEDSKMWIEASIKNEPDDEENSLLEKLPKKQESDENSLLEELPKKPESDEEYSPDGAELSEDDVRAPTTKRVLRKRNRKLAPAERHSYVQSIKNRYPELRKDEKLLVDSLVAIMKETKPPPPPSDYYVMKGAKLKCVECSHQSVSMPAASRHYQEKHGKRYLYCLACGVNFRSKTNLYKHEKMCDAPDALTVLRARALFLGHKGRSRPFADEAQAKPKTGNKTVKKEPIIRKYGTKNNYTPETLERALMTVRHGGSSVRAASIKYKVPMSTLTNKLRNAHCKTVGRPAVFSAADERAIHAHVSALADCGVPVRAADVRKMIRAHLDRHRRTVAVFNNNLPGKDWSQSFLLRHPDLKRRLDWNFINKRDKINSRYANEFFDRLEDKLGGTSAANVYAFSEVGFDDDLMKKRVIFQRDLRHPTRTSTKSRYTVVFCGNAAGEMLPPFFIFQGNRTEDAWLERAPRGSGMTWTDSGWLDLESFDVWFEDHFLPAVAKKRGKKILIGDSLSSHLSMSTMDSCDENDVKFICSVPNSGALLAPLSGFLDLLETSWRDEVADSAAERPLSSLPEQGVVHLIARTVALDAGLVARSLSAGFEACGIHPVDRREVLKRLLGLPYRRRY